MSSLDFTNEKIIKKCQESPIYFVKIMWGLVPQPIKTAYKKKARELIESGDFNKIKASWFQDFEKGKHITWQQWLILKAVEKALRGDATRQISVASGHGTGKSTVLAWLILWFLFCFYRSQVPCTAPSSDQIHDILWKEIKKWMGDMPKPVQEKYDWKTEYVRITEDPKTWFARAKTARKESPEALSGMHGDHLMLIVDEASGVAQEIFEAAEGSLTNENPIYIMISNPTRVTGKFYESHNDEASMWQSINLSSEDSPIVGADYIEKMAMKHGRDSDEFGIRVLGKFPDEEGADDKGYVPLISRETLEGALTSDREIRKGNRKTMIDPAGEGSNKTVWGIRDRYKIRVLNEEDKSKPGQIAATTNTLRDQHEMSIEEQRQTFVDAFGVGSKAAVEISKSDNHEYCVAVNTGDKVDSAMTTYDEDEDMFLNLRALLFWRLREFLLEGGELVRHDGWEQLLWIKFRRTRAGKIQIIPKRQIVKEYGESPDYADMASLGFLDKQEDVKLRKEEQRQVEENRRRRKERKRQDVGL